MEHLLRNFQVVNSNKITTLELYWDDEAMKTPYILKQSEDDNLPFGKQKDFEPPQIITRETYRNFANQAFNIQRETIRVKRCEQHHGGNITFTETLFDV